MVGRGEIALLVVLNLMYWCESGAQEWCWDLSYRFVRHEHTEG